MAISTRSYAHKRGVKQLTKPSNHRFKSFTYVDDFPKEQETGGRGRQHRSALAEDGYYRESSSNLKTIIPKHNKLSNDFCNWLMQNGVPARQEENNIDILFDINGIRYIAELKIVYGVGTTKAIREALGQLLEYNYYPGREANEIGNALTAMIKRKQISKNEALSAFKITRNIPVRLIPADIQKALEIAMRFNIYAYDAYFIQVAQFMACPLLTLDKRMKEVAGKLNISLLE